VNFKLLNDNSGKRPILLACADQTLQANLSQWLKQSGCFFYSAQLDELNNPQDDWWNASLVIVQGSKPQIIHAHDNMDVPTMLAVTSETQLHSLIEEDLPRIYGLISEQTNKEMFLFNINSALRYVDGLYTKESFQIIVDSMIRSRIDIIEQYGLLEHDLLRQEKINIFKNEVLNLAKPAMIAAVNQLKLEELEFKQNN
jgi:hypothetical protein